MPPPPPPSPQANDVAAITEEDNAVDIVLSGTFDPTTTRIERSPDHGALTPIGDARYRYAPAADFHGVDTFAYSATDGQGTPSNLATVTITVQPLNDAPNAVDLELNTPANTILRGNLIAADPDDDALTFSLVSDASHGAVEVAADGRFSYEPHADFAGRDEFQFRASDGVAESSDARVSVSVSAHGRSVNSGVGSALVMLLAAVALGMRRKE